MAAGITFEPIATTNSPSGTSYTFSNIPQNYTDLVVVVSIKMSGNTTLRLRFNGSSSGYSYKHYLSDGSSSQGSASQADLVDNNGSVLSNFYLDVMNYVPTTLVNKSFLFRSGDMTYGWLGSGAWNSSAAITSIELLTTNGQTFSSPSVLTLYGIARA